ncbi:MAG TPA: HlyD family efflux transporter periplasmic adaptor subunit [Gemmatimonadaceae bacterium]|jgi:HlyD family secretion protein|nr:HlyD family efflux transporter periplasmic adaptor subunit [Gemmatimonadaceae bacterium]
MMRMYSFAAIAALLVAATACRRGPKPDAYGNIEATEVVVGAQAGGQLESFTPAEGNVLPLGATVGMIDTTTASLQLQQVSAQRTASASRATEVTKQIGVLEAQRPIAQRGYERTRRLFEQQAATAQQLDQAEREYRTLVAQLEVARVQRQAALHDVTASDARAAQVRDQLRKSVVTNPVGGTVLTTYVRTGELVQVGQPLYKIANLDTMELRAYVTETQLASIKVGKQVTVSIDVGAARRPLPGVVSWVSPTAEFTPTPIETRDERVNLVYAVKIRVPNPNGILKIGMPADVQLTTVASR